MHINWWTEGWLHSNNISELFVSHFRCWNQLINFFNKFIFTICHLPGHLEDVFIGCHGNAVLGSIFCSYGHWTNLNVVFLFFVFLEFLQAWVKGLFPKSQVFSQSWQWKVDIMYHLDIDRMSVFCCLHKLIRQMCRSTVRCSVWSESFLSFRKMQLFDKQQ